MSGVIGGNEARPFKWAKICLLLFFSSALLPVFTLSTSKLNLEISSGALDPHAGQLHNAVDATFTFTTGPRAFHIVRFVPAAACKLSDTCSNQSAADSVAGDPSPLAIQSLLPATPQRFTASALSPPSSINQTEAHSLLLANASYLINRTEEQVLPLTLWADRSVLIFTIRQLSFRRLAQETRYCGRIRICAIPWDLADPQLADRMDLLCSTALKQIYLSCLDDSVVYKPLILPLAHALAIEVDELPEVPGRRRPSLSITASAGYSLPAGQFCCPDGLFACLPPSQTAPIAGQSWSQRICLPRDLRCDGVVNCPLGDSDEQNCSVAEQPPSHFDPTPADEFNQFVTYLHTVRPSRLVTEAGYTSIAALGAASYNARLSWYTPIILAVLVTVLMLIGCFVLARVLCKSGRSKSDNRPRFTWPGSFSPDSSSGHRTPLTAEDGKAPTTRMDSSSSSLGKSGQTGALDATDSGAQLFSPRGGSRTSLLNGFQRGDPVRK